MKNFARNPDSMAAHIQAPSNSSHRLGASSLELRLQCRRRPAELHGCKGSVSECGGSCNIRVVVSRASSHAVGPRLALRSHDRATEFWTTFGALGALEFSSDAPVVCRSLVQESRRQAGTPLGYGPAGLQVSSHQHDLRGRYCDHTRCDGIFIIGRIILPQIDMEAHRWPLCQDSGLVRPPLNFHVFSRGV